MQAKLNDAVYQTGRIDAVITHTNEGNSIVEAAKRSFYFGQSAMRYLRPQPVREAKQLFPIRVAYIRNWRILAADPVHFVGLVVFKIVR